MNYVRTGDNVWQPHDMPTHNEELMRPLCSPRDVVYFAGQDDGAAWCFFEPSDISYKVGKTPREEFEPIQYWSSFWEWLFEETGQLASVFNLNGTRQLAID